MIVLLVSEYATNSERSVVLGGIVHDGPTAVWHNSMSRGCAIPAIDGPNDAWLERSLTLRGR